MHETKQAKPAAPTPAVQDRANVVQRESSLGGALPAMAPRTSLAADIDASPRVAAQRRIAQFVDASPRQAAAHALVQEFNAGRTDMQPGRAAGTQPVAQALMSRAAFIASTKNGQARKSIAAIDAAIEAYEIALGTLPAPDNDAKIPLLQAIKRVVDAYVLDKETTDAGNTRIAPVKRFKEDVDFTLADLQGNGADTAAIDTAIADHPDDDATRDLMVGKAKVPSLLPKVRQYIAATSNVQKAATLCRLHTANQLQAVVDTAFADGAGLTALGQLQTGAAMSAQEIAIHDFFMAKTAVLANAKTILAHRFTIPVGNIDSLEADQPNVDGGQIGAVNVADWTLPGLKRVYDAMTVLPPGHASSNASLQHIRRFTQTGSGWHGGDCMAIGYANGTENAPQADRQTRGDWWARRGHDAFAGKNMLDAVVRHEVGHAVDAKGNFSGANSALPMFGNWREYGGVRIDLIKDYLTTTGSPLRTYPPFAKPVIEAMVSDIMESVLDVNDLKTRLINMMQRFADSDGVPRLDANRIRSDSLFTDLTLANLKAPYQSAAPTVVGGRTFVYSNERTMSSYASAARGRQVSNYQFRSPKEWFAEAYAAFYQPDTSDRGHGEALRKADNATFNFFLANVHQALP